MSEQRWKTDQELEHIERIGQALENKKLSRVEMLRRYLDAARKRCYWDGIDAKKVIRFAEAELEKAISHSIREPRAARKATQFE